MNGIKIKVSDGSISISIIGANKDLNLNENEADLAATFIECLISAGINGECLSIERKSDDYATIVYHGCEWDSDLARFKYTQRAKWIAVPIPESRIEQLKDNPIFDAQKNKRQIMWKSKITTTDDARSLAKIASEYLIEVQTKFPEYR